MALHFSGNQYEQAFDPKRLQNWEVAKRHRQRPKSLDGFTQIIATDRGHLFPGVRRSGESPWGTFVGTWDMPLKIPGNKMTNPTARSTYAQEKLHKLKGEGDLVIKGTLKAPPKIPTPPGPLRHEDIVVSGKEKVPDDKPTHLEDSAENDIARSGAKGPTPPAIMTRTTPVRVTPPAPKDIPPEPKLATPVMAKIPTPVAREMLRSPKMKTPERKTPVKTPDWDAQQPKTGARPDTPPNKVNEPLVA
ncbi:protein Flattop homolog [Lingula anatina]|uniref:Cilia- and flagella-associated protein 126 n=1 Tax=Lingula anatina TaxID=7574 RepID=A0A1S3HR34_LINAN|nr:protein Flattop homolog [Lingula anatina]|eukprot:XP_013415546.1 protein Flattop homolog [Lingula anatina]